MQSIIWSIPGASELFRAPGNLIVHLYDFTRKLQNNGIL